MRKIFNCIIILTLIFCMNVKANNEEIEELSEYMYINPKWTEYNNLSEEEKKNYEAIPEKYIYEYIPKKTTSILNDYYNYFYAYGDDELETYYNLANVDGKRYINSTNKNQSSLGLCWAFAGIGSLESNILINGVKGLDEAIAKCDESNLDSVYCQYKNDKETNDYYISNAIACESGNCVDENGTASKKVIDNAKFSERAIDYLRSRPANSTAYNSTTKTYTLIAEEYNPYTGYEVIGSGGWFKTAAKYFSYGVAPIRMLEGTQWEKYTVAHNTLSLYDVFDNPGSIYQVRNYYKYPSAPSNLEAKELWIDELKANIKKYGSVYVGTNVPDSRAGTCYFNDTVNNVRLINDTGSCGVSGGHAMQIIGWDDEYKFAYCKVTSVTNGVSSYSSSANYTQEECEKLAETTANDTTTKSGIWTEGTGAWILKNNWGTSTTYPYLSYQSTGLDISGVREVSVPNYDNIYNIKNTVYDIKTVSVNNEKQTTYTYYKTIDKEYLTSVNVEVDTYKKDMNVYISVDGENYSLIDTQYIDYPGLYTFDVDNLELTKNKFFIKITGVTVSSSTAFTKSECSMSDTCGENIEIKSIIQNEYDVNHYLQSKKDFNIITNTRNIQSGQQLEYKIYDDTGLDISGKFDMTNNYIVDNRNIASFVLNEDLPVGRYYLHTTYGDVTDIFEFYIINEVEINFEMPYPIFNTDSSTQITYNLKNSEGTSNYEWKSSNEDVATIDENGLLNIKNHGFIDITLSMDTYYGEISKTERVYIYKKIYSVAEFLEMQSSSSAFYLMNDLDFSGVNFSDYENNTFTGVFDGGGHTLKNINKSFDSNNQDIGLFNQTDGAFIRNFTIVNSTFVGSTTAGSVVGYAKNTTIENVYNYANVKSANKTGGLIGESQYANIRQCFNGGYVETISTKNYSYSGGIIGYSNYDNVENSYNEGKVYSETQWERVSLASQATAGGIIGHNKLSTISNSYNVGEVVGYSSISTDTINSNGLNRFYNSDTYNIQDFIKNSYYLENDTYTITYSDYERSLVNLKKKSNYIDWDFDNVWYMEDGVSLPVLRGIMSDEVEQVNFNIFSNILNENSVYDFTYEIVPNNINDNVNIYSEDEELFEVNSNQITTKSKIGTANIVFEIQNTKYKYPITVKSLLNYSYDKNMTNEDLEINLNINYYKDVLDTNSYLKLIYSINEKQQEIEFNKGIKENNYTFSVTENSSIKLEMQLCGTTCNTVKEDSFDIENIDKIKPEINIEYDNITSKLKINIIENIENGLSEDDVYEYAFSDSNTLAPITFNSYTPNVEMNNIFINHTMKYLWIKNISDKAGNKIEDEKEYIVYTMDINNYYNVNYYDKDKKTILKTEKIEEGSVLTINYAANDYEDNDYIYKFDSWEGYIEGMKVTSDINLYPIYNKTPKKLSSNTFIIKNGYIYNIKIKNVNKNYGIEEFKNNLINYKTYNFYENNKLVNPIYIKTGLIYKNNSYEYKIVLAGDVTGDGYIKMNDVMKIANHIVNNNVLYNEYYVAGDVTGDGAVKMNDIMKIASGIVNGGSL